MELKELASNHLGDYEPEVANLYLTFRSPKVEDGASQYTITARVPKKSDSGKFKTGTKSIYGSPSDDEFKSFIDEVRKKRDAIFFKEYGLAFNKENAESIRVKDYPRNSATGIGGLIASRSDYQFKVSYVVDGETLHRAFPLVNYGSEDAAYVEAAKFLARTNGEKLLTDAEYLSKRPAVIFPEFGTDEWELKNRLLREIKESVTIDKSGIEVSAEMRLLGFYANYFTELSSGGRKGQRRKSFNALLRGENEAFLTACRTKDEMDGKPILSDEEYLKLKPVRIFEGLTPP